MPVKAGDNQKAVSRRAVIAAVPAALILPAFAPLNYSEESAQTETVQETTDVSHDWRGLPV